MISEQDSDENICDGLHNIHSHWICLISFCSLIKINQLKKTQIICSFWRIMSSYHGIHSCMTKLGYISELVFWRSMRSPPYHSPNLSLFFLLQKFILAYLSQKFISSFILVFPSCQIKRCEILLHKLQKMSARHPKEGCISQETRYSIIIGKRMLKKYCCCCCCLSIIVCVFF